MDRKMKGREEEWGTEREDYKQENESKKASKTEKLKEENKQTVEFKEASGQGKVRRKIKINEGKERKREHGFRV